MWWDDDRRVRQRVRVVVLRLDDDHRADLDGPMDPLHVRNGHHGRRRLHARVAEQPRDVREEATRPLLAIGRGGVLRFDSIGVGGGSGAGTITARRGHGSHELSKGAGTSGELTTSGIIKGRKSSEWSHRGEERLQVGSLRGGNAPSGATEGRKGSK